VSLSLAAPLAARLDLYGYQARVTQLVAKVATHEAEHRRAIAERRLPRARALEQALGALLDELRTLRRQLTPGLVAAWKVRHQVDARFFWREQAALLRALNPRLLELDVRGV
jgi:hypothetical protein